MIAFWVVSALISASRALTVVSLPGWSLLRVRTGLMSFRPSTALTTISSFGLL